MKTNFLLLIALLLLISCSEDPKLVLFSPEAFAFSLDNGWEVDASVNAKGFAQIKKENSDLYFSHLDYSVNLYSANDTIINADFDSLIDSSKEKLMDLQIESQLELNSGFSKGKYKVEFIVEDKYSSTKDTLSAEFNLD